MVRLTIITGVIQQLYWPLFTNVSLTDLGIFKKWHGINLQNTEVEITVLADCHS